jgi:murein L,D-transpeptidase YafK
LSGAPVPNPTRRPKLPLVVVVTGLLALIALLIWRPDFSGIDPEQRAIVAERAQRYARASLGRPLDGTPDLADLTGRLAAQGIPLGSPVLIRIHKREFELELWLARDGRFHRFATYPICRWSGWLGPKLATGDKQAPEGFYTVDGTQLNPNSRWHRSFNLGFPNAMDRSLGRTGSALMVHGGCSSVGCFAMTNAVVDEVWRLITAALSKSQKRLQVQVFPFRMNEETLAAHGQSPHIAFWRDLKIGHDLFEANGLPPTVTACRGRYRFAPGSGQADVTAPIVEQCSDTVTEKQRSKKSL